MDSDIDLTAYYVLVSIFGGICVTAVISYVMERIIK